MQNEPSGFLFDTRLLGVPPIGEAKSIDCPVCFVPAGERCLDSEDRVIPYHVGRARAAREQAMGIGTHAEIRKVFS